MDSKARYVIHFPVQLRPAIPDVKGPTNFICYWRIFVIGSNKSNRTTMRPLGIYLIAISIYILNMIHFMMILVNFGVFSLMLTDIRTDQRTDGPTDGRTDPHIEMRGRI